MQGGGQVERVLPGRGGKGAEEVADREAGLIPDHVEEKHPTRTFFPSGCQVGADSSLGH